MNNEEPEVVQAKQLQMLAELCQLQGNILKGMLKSGYVPANLQSLVGFTEGMSMLATSLSEMMSEQTTILLMKAELGKM